MRLLRTHSTRSWQRLAGVTAALPLLVAGLLASPAQAAPASESIIASGIYNSSGTGCQGSGTSADCLSWGIGHCPEELHERHHRGRLRPRPVGVELPRERPDRRHGIVLRLPEQQAERVQPQVLRKASLRRIRRQRRTGRGRHVHPGASEHHLQDRSPGALRRLIPRPELWNDDDDPRVRRVHLLLLADCHDLRRQHTSEDHSNCEEAC